MILKHVIVFFTSLNSYVARDIGGADPERMAPPKVEEYVRDAFADTPVNLEVISDLKTLEKEFPLFAAVNRAANGNNIFRSENY